MPKPKWLEPVEQFAHFWMGLGASLANAGLVLWWYEWVKQWPVERPEDTKTDLFWMEVGRTVGWFGTVGLGVLIGWWIWG